MSELLENLGKTAFSGSCTFTLEGHAGSVVTKDGRVVLATLGHKSGNTAVEEILAHSDREIDAALSLLSPAQLKLATEFNQNARVTEPAGGKKHTRERKPHPEEERPIGQPPGSHKTAGEMRGQKPAQDVQPGPAEDGMPGTAVSDLDALDSIDLESMTEKIRDNCRNTIRQLHLDYLLMK
ncbi:MAG: hypothetical protein LUQ25_08585 [Methanoregulaceae archaeon]|nr:hypothetical protein [Methanoregulaceae archaeon]